MNKLVIICAVLLIVILTLSLAVSCKKSGTTNQTSSSTTTNTSVITQQTSTAATTGATTTATTTDPLFIKHSLQGRPDCLSCHKPGAAAAIVFHSPTVPANHSSYTNDNCMKSGCHYIK